MGYAYQVRVISSVEYVVHRIGHMKNDEEHLLLEHVASKRLYLKKRIANAPSKKTFSNMTVE